MYLTRNYFLPSQKSGMWDKIMLSLGWKRPSRDEVMAELAKLEAMGEVRLLCWCAPRSCHCDVIKSYLEWRNPVEQLSLEQELIPRK